MRLLPLFLLAVTTGLLCNAAASAQVVAPSVRITDRINESDLVTLRGNAHPLANAKHDRGRVAPDLAMTDLILVLSRAPGQQAAFDTMVASQYNPDSPNFHHWLTPEQVGTDFGPSQTDIATISNWLAGHGFSIGEVTKDRMSIRFSGTAAQVESAFHTEIHHLAVKGVQHIGNMSDPQIPAALAQAVVGVKSLHNFFARPLYRLGNTVAKDSATGKWQRLAGVPAESVEGVAAKAAKARPEFAINVPASGNVGAYLVEDVTPYDFATIYNVLPLWTASSPIDGTGQTIAIAGTSAINIGTSIAGANGQNDIATFRSTFGLPAYAANQFTMVSGNSQPLTVCADPGNETNPPPCTVDDLTENTLDVEWAGSIAKGANIVLVASYPASTSDDNLYDSESYIVNNKTASIMNVSYGQCELDNGTAGNVEYYNLWQTAATEGIAVFVATGDGGSAECDDGGDAIGNPYSAQYGLAVSGLASTPFNTAVGGTDFSWCTPGSSAACTAAPYWNSTNAANGSSALGYIPEIPWNDTCAGPQGTALMIEQAKNYSIGGVSDAESACNFVYNDWSYIYQDTGGSTSGVNLSYYLDVVGAGGGASGCVVNSSTSTTNGACSTGATSTGSSDGNITLVNNGWPKPSWQSGVTGIVNDNVRDLPDISFFASDGFLSNSAYLVCVSALDPANAACTYSTTSDPRLQEVGGTSVATATMSGVMALINQKAGTAQGSPNAELYKLAGAQTYSNCSAERTSGIGSCYFNDIDTGTNAMPCDYGANEGDPTVAGIKSPNCTPATSGDLIGVLPSYSAGKGYDQATGLGSMNVANVVNAWVSALGTGTAKVTVAPTSLSLNAGTALSVPVTVASSVTGGTAPTGTVTLSGGLSGYPATVGTLVSGSYTFTIPANSLASGNDTLTAYYSGDANYSFATGTANVAVTGGASSATFTLAATTPAAVAPGTSASSTVTVTATGGYAGTATLACALTASPSGAVDVPTCSIATPTATLSTTTTTGTVTVAVATTAATTAQLQPRGKGNIPGWLGAGGGSLLALVIFMGIPARRRSWKALLGALVVMAALSGVSGCGNFWVAPSGNTGAGTTAGAYTFTVTGTGNPAVSPAPTTTFIVTVN
ncbi:MAG: protease pro-enzyme activation domain-containing protein [Terracidiphilus sp.]|jgi:subtilase family serine protease